MNPVFFETHAYYQPSECARRTYLNHRGEAEAKPYEQTLVINSMYPSGDFPVTDTVGISLPNQKVRNAHDAWVGL